MATPFKASILLVNARNPAMRKTIGLTASDVAAAGFVFPSGEGASVVSAADCLLADISLSAAGADTTQHEIFINGVSTGVKNLNAMCLYTVNGGRPQQQAPIRIPAGAVLKIVQLA